MRTRLTWKETGPNARTLKLDDTTFDHLPTVDEHVPINDLEYRVVGVESAVVLLELVPAPTHVEDAASVPAVAPATARASAPTTSAPATKAAPASKLADHKPAPHHVPQRRHTDPLRRAKAVSHKKK